MRKGLLSKLEEMTAREALKRGGLRCPDCGETPMRTPEDLGGVVACEACGTKASVQEWVRPRGGPLEGKAGAPPMGTKIRKEEDGFGKTIWRVPGGGRSGFLLFFGLFWCGVTAVVSGGFALAFFSGKKTEGGFPEWALIPFFGLFWAVGLGLLYASLRAKFLRHRIAIGGGELIWTKEMFGRKKTRLLAAEDIREVGQTVFFTENDKPVYGIEIKGVKEKVRFGSGLKDEEKAWLAAELKEAIFGKAEPRPLASPARRTGGGAGYFSVGVPAPGVGSVAMAAAFAAFGGAFVWVGLALMDGTDAFFKTMWVAISAIFAAGGAASAVALLRARTRERRIEGTDGLVSIRTYHRGRVMREESIARNEVTDVRAAVIGDSNGRPMKRVELIAGDRAVPVARWLDEAKTDALVRELREGLWGS